ncbi:MULTISPECIES: hypothetical protein [Photorhabdus]|nr:hypothetical protein [Photorhabdus laumondii]
MFAALAEFERGLIRERTQAGPVAANRSWTTSRCARSKPCCAIPIFRWPR